MPISATLQLPNALREPVRRPHPELNVSCNFCFLGVGALSTPWTSIGAINKMKNLALGRVIHWTPQSSFEDVDRIYTTEALSLALERIQKGTAWLVLGRKGVGKSALIYKFLDKEKSKILARKREFDPALIFDRLRFFGAQGIASSAHKVFKLDILLLAAEELRLVLPDGRLRRAAHRIARYYERRWLTELLTRVRKSKVLEALSRVFTGGEGLGRAASGLFSDVSAVDRELTNVTGLMRELCGRIANIKPVYIIFDEVDLTLTKGRNQPEYPHYITALAGLLEAASAFSDLRALGIPVYPVVVLRDDIFSEITSADTGKWFEAAVHVHYSGADIERLLRFRLLTELRKADVAGVADDATLEKVWSHFSDNKVCPPTRKTILQLVLQRTLNRPRDIVQYMQKLATAVSKRQGAVNITPTDFERARSPYAKYFWSEFSDEIGYKYPFRKMIEEALFDCFHQSVGQNVVQRRTMVKGGVLRERFARLQEALESEGVRMGSPEHLVADLMKSSILGVQIATPKGPRIAFKYLDGVDRAFAWEMSYCVHGAVSDYFYLRGGRDANNPPVDFDEEAVQGN
jgi:hypothetical protein